MKKITKRSKLMDIVKEKPESMEILGEYGLHCIGCAMAHFETLEQGCKAHGMSDKDIEKIVKEINSTKEKKK